VIDIGDREALGDVSWPAEASVEAPAVNDFGVQPRIGFWLDAGLQCAYAPGLRRRFGLRGTGR
jgi:hypothetical protein